MLLSNRYLKRFYLINMWVHGVCGVLILGTTYILGFLAIADLSWEIVALPHTIMGFSVLILVGLLVIGGLLTRYV